MYLITNLKNDIKNILTELGYDEDVVVIVSNRPELGDYQFNGCMQIAGKYHVNPRELADKIVEQLSKNEKYTNLNVAGLIRGYHLEICIMSLIITTSFGEKQSIKTSTNANKTPFMYCLR